MAYLVLWRLFSKVRVASTRFSDATIVSSPAIVKMFYARRNPDTAQKKQIMESSSVIAEIMLKHLRQELSGAYARCRCFRGDFLIEFLADPVATYTYYTMMLGLITVLLVNGLLIVLHLPYLELNERYFDFRSEFTEYPSHRAASSILSCWWSRCHI
jgi:hypothetical protein